MIFKLVKHEFKSSIKTMLFLYALVIAMSIVTTITFSRKVLEVTSNSLSGTVFSLIIVATMFLAAGICYMMLYVTLYKRFTSILFKKEGYLMHTLPITKNELLLSVLINTVILIIMTLVTYIISILICTSLIKDYTGWSLFETINQISYKVPNFYLYIIEYIVLILISFLSFAFQIYLSASIGHVFSKNRKIVSIAAFFGISFIINLVSNNVIFNQSLFIETNITTVDYLFNSNLFDFNRLFITSIIFYTFIIIACYFGVHYIVKNKLNLE